MAIARPRVYRENLLCPRCGSNRLPKYGRSGGKHTWRCGRCLYHFIPGVERPQQPEQMSVASNAFYWQPVRST